MSVRMFIFIKFPFFISIFHCIATAIVGNKHTYGAQESQILQTPAVFRQCDLTECFFTSVLLL